MREIKFRAWDTYSKPNKMVQFKDGDFIAWHAPSNWKDCYILMQYTGLKDKNGKEIYEGDVVKSFHNNECSVIRFGEYKHIVGFEEEDIYNCIGFYFGKDIIPFAKDIYGQTNKYEVIGNIYENTELLKND